MVCCPVLFQARPIDALHRTRYSLIVDSPWSRTLPRCNTAPGVIRDYEEILIAGAINSEDFGDLPLELFHPRLSVFTFCLFGNNAPVSCLFQATWFNELRWLHYDLAQDAARCFTCCKVIKDGRAVAIGVTDRAFLVKGFTNWKDATCSFSTHESCDFHKVCAAALATTVNVGDMLSQ